MPRLSLHRIPNLNACVSTSRAEQSDPVPGTFLANKIDILERKESVKAGSITEMEFRA
jgi:hypothetical protein